MKENLTSANMILKLMNGTLLVDSDEDKTKMTIHLNQTIIEKVLLYFMTDEKISLYF